MPSHVIAASFHCTHRISHLEVSWQRRFPDEIMDIVTIAAGAGAATTVCTRTDTS